MRRVVGILVAVTLVFVAVSPASANNDPHRFPFGFGSFDLAGACPFVVHFDTWGREYAKGAVLPDGSTAITFTGFAAGTLSNAVTGSSIELNLSGPGTFTFAPDGSFVGQVTTGRGILWAPNLTDFGLPSNLVATSGPSSWAAVAADNWAGYVITSMRTPPHVATDVCAALG